MQTFMATVDYMKLEYRGDSKRNTQNFTVSAEDWSSARDKVYEHFKAKSDPYGTQYHVYNVEIWVHID